MKKILGFILCMGIFLAGSTALYGSPPTNEAVQYEMGVDVGQGITPERLDAVTPVFDLVMRQVLAERATEIAALYDVSDLRMVIADLRSNATDRKLAAEPIKETPVHRWRDYRGRYCGVPIYTIHRPGWRSRTCEV